MPQAINCMCYSIFFPPAQKDFHFFHNNSRFMLFFTGDVVLGRFVSGFESAAFCDILGCPRSCFPIPRESFASSSVL